MTKENVHPRLESLDILLCTKTIVEHLDTLSSAWGNISVTLHLEPVSNHPNSKNLDVFASCETWSSCCLFLQMTKLEKSFDNAFKS